MLTDDDRADLVEEIQRATAGMDDKGKLRVLRCWEFMAAELARALAFAQREPQPTQQQPLRDQRAA